ncbi:MAG TPA: low molecular weight protein-tyrosine-phosphatase [Jiangellales bacterium]|nr:low molecular weight protein-tyrosine-phosphatase [Jiangellales bacterium]
MSQPFRVVLVCLGNICRSPMAEAVLRDRVAAAGLADRVSVESAGTAGYHVGSGADPRALAALRARGYDGTEHRARRFGSDWFGRADLVLALDDDNLATLAALASGAAARRHLRMFRSYDPAAVREGDLEVPDPYYGGADGFEHVLDLVERAADGLVAELTRTVGDGGAEGSTRHGG